MLDGGQGAKPDGRLDAWLVTDERGELMREIRRLSRARGLEPAVKTYSSGDLTIEPRLVVHTTHSLSAPRLNLSTLEQNYAENDFF
jgi:hypothetical protein